MVVFIVLSALALALAGAVAIPFIVIGAVIWLVTFPIRLLFKLIGGILGMVFGLIGGLLGLIIGPIVMVVVVIALIGALLTAVLSLLAPLLPVGVARTAGLGDLPRNEASEPRILIISAPCRDRVQRSGPSLFSLPVLACVLAPLRRSSARNPRRIAFSSATTTAVRAPGIAIVAQTLQAIGQVIVVAPADNQSGKGHSIVTTEPCSGPISRFRTV
jgi:hypothetical protein